MLQRPVRLALAATLAAGVSGCGLWPHWPPAAPPPELDFQSVTLRRLDCLRGNCPDYSVTIDRDGRVRYHGRDNVAVIGRREGRANPRALTTLRRLLAKPEFYWMPDRFVPMHDNCGDWVLDAGTAIIRLESANLDKHIVHYLGCHGAPRLLTSIEMAIDSAAHATAWTAAPTSHTSPLP